MFSTLREPPKKGSLRESVLLLYVLKREDISYMRDLAVAQMQISKEKGVELFNEYRQKMFPWVDKAQEREKDFHKNLLAQIVKNGPISVTPLHTPQAKSRLVQRKERVETTPAQRKRQNDLYKKLGKSIPV